MDLRTRRQQAAALFSFLLLFSPWSSARDEPPDRYKDLGGRVEAQFNGKAYVFPILKTDIEADIQGDLVSVQVVQTFANPLSTPVHASYLFPLNHDAAVHAMTMEVGDEKVQAQIKRTEEARATFEHAKSEGKSAALLTQHRPNMFTQNLANLMPGLPIKVTLRYVQTVPKVDGQYELQIPMVVGPRYQPKGAGASAEKSVNSNADDKNVAAEDDIPPGEPDDTGESVEVARNAKAAKSLHSKKAFNRWEVEALPAYPPVNGLDIPDEVDAERVGIVVHVNGGMPIAELASPTHKLTTERPTPEHADVRLADGRTIDNKNFILTYRLAGASNQAGLLGYRDQRGGFFSLLIEPPAIPAEADVTPREMVFVLDCSGSMSGLPMEASKAFMGEALRKLRPTDHFRIIRFSDAATEFSAQPMPATPDNIQAGIKYADSLVGEGGTEMSTGIRQALTPPVPPNTVRLVSFLTDGYIGNESEILALIKANLNGARLYAFGVGAEVNRYLLNEMSIVGRGFARYMDPTENVQKVAEELAGRLQSPVLTDIDIDWGGLSVSEQSPAAIPDLFAGQSVRVQGRYAYPGTYLIKVKGLVNGRHASLPMQVSLPESSQQGEAVPVIWARAAIAQTMRALTTADMSNSEASQKDQLKQKVIDLGLEFSLVTQWTSFVAVSEKVYNPNPKQAKDARVPLPMVKGTSPLAYGKPAIAPMQTAMNGGFAGYGAPEPGLVAGFAVIFMMFAGFFWRGARRVSCA